jgi:hypothetical protein
MIIKNQFGEKVEGVHKQQRAFSFSPPPPQHLFSILFELSTTTRNLLLLQLSSLNCCKGCFTFFYSFRNNFCSTFDVTFIAFKFTCKRNPVELELSFEKIHQATFNLFTIHTPSALTNYYQTSPGENRSDQGNQTSSNQTFKKKQTKEHTLKIYMKPKTKTLKKKYIYMW